MLEPREADIPALFLFLVVLPLVAYVLLGKWSESAKKRERINLLAELAAEEALRAEAMAVGDVIPLVASTKNGNHACARCFGPATTRCSKCKSVRYCSGKCQIIHWREVHKQECQQMKSTNSGSPLMAASVEDSMYERFLPNESMDSLYFGYNIEQAMVDKEAPENIIYPSVSNGISATIDRSASDASQVSVPERRSTEKRASRKSNKETVRRKDSVAPNSSIEVSGSWNAYTTSSNVVSSKEVLKGHRSRNTDSFISEESSTKQSINISDVYIHERATPGSTLPENGTNESQYGNTLEPENHHGFSCSSYSSKNGSNGYEIGKDFNQNGGNLLEVETTSHSEQVEFECSPEMTAVKGGAKPKRPPYSLGSKSCKLPKSTLKEKEEHFCSEREWKGQVLESKSSRMRDAPMQACDGGANTRILKMMGLKKPTKLTRKDVSEVSGDRHKTKMLFPYEEFVKFFQCDVFNLSYRGLLNCGNSCYANAVLQCLTSTKPLIIYLLRRSHSRSCCGKDWCLMCELEQHVMMLRETGGPLSPSRILSHMRSINCHIGDGSQEDAHEFLRLLIASMQSICLEGLGGESKVDPRLQETTFIQHTFGGHLRSKVKCLKCRHESERYENIMDLTLEIYGWVESLEDALTQFTTPEDLDGENMYRCGRCATYVRARKQLSIHEAPNILTIVLKRFQEGKYGKINKCITFPDMLDMIPFMTGTGDIPPLYLLYAVVVHLDTLNASFSGHYVSYVKDLQGNWFRIDDIEVQPVAMSQVMSEGAYILFYMRSCPRPQRTLAGRAIQQQVPEFTTHCTSKPSRSGKSKPNGQYVGPESLSDDIRAGMGDGFAHHTSNNILRSANRTVVPAMETRLPNGAEFSDATSSDWSLFTSSDEASFTTESTRDSFSTVDYADTCNVDPFSSIFHGIYAPDYPHNSVSCRNLLNNRPQTRFMSQEKDHILDSYLSSSAQPLDRLPKVDYSQQVSDSPTAFSSDSNCGMFVRYGGSNPVEWD
ncbi:ubiquitin carboxyl-terminal hydrolase 15 [Humulus lupulus]|uniref:ubiquitin carboxyl-terminal hydrolase 15 n=1 Tax=Humulus lupulus TaxID=3486 RepID=UPI002B40A18D|nr:ubiquitin carboxyl-terminal hydrolase 15 [Humulus lupulus]XP_062090165.1 ubiquitin carboxyl-terminal hydrolase 15 [Humulus lupulus]